MITKRAVQDQVAEERARREIIRGLERGIEEYKDPQKLKEIIRETGIPARLVLRASKIGNFQGLAKQVEKAVETKANQYKELMVIEHQEGGYAVPFFAFLNDKGLDERVECPEYFLVLSQGVENTILVVSIKIDFSKVKPSSTILS